jgi:N-acetylglucosaminyldiphosphoundecaprenol N-acetyl-beta-D-mannosaminyltransferase
VRSPAYPAVVRAQSATERSIRSPGSVPHRFILGMRVDATTYHSASREIIDWAKAGQSRYVCVAAVNNVMESYDDPSFLDVMNRADLITSDGMPLVWGLRGLGVPGAKRVYGTHLSTVLLGLAEREGIGVGFLGGGPDVLRKLTERAWQRWPHLNIVYTFSPPFRPLTQVEDQEMVRDINNAGTQLLFVGLGCPKQERWMARQRGRVGAVMVGVGAAFDYMARTKKQAPPLLQRAGLEWLFRLAIEPRRLWRRYLRQNPRFVALFGQQLLLAWLGVDSRGKRGQG